MGTQRLNFLATEASEAPGAAKEQSAPAYRRPQLLVAGSAVELVQGCYCADARDISGYYTFADLL